MVRAIPLLGAVALLLGSGCEDDSDLVLDAGPPRDAGEVRDAAPSDAGPSDAGAPDTGVPDTGLCPPVPSCNWCGGDPTYDGLGCVVGYVCANGVDPCQTDPCSQTPPTGCAPGEICEADMLCWPAPGDGGVSDAGVAPDAEPSDAAAPDAGTPPDAGHIDAGLMGAPVCDNIGTRSEGWYRPDGSRVCYAMCAQDVADCLNVGTRSEGWYARRGAGCNEDRIEWANCAP